jgi:hypothetical protein
MHYFLRQNLFEEQGIIEIVGHTEVTAQYQWTAGIKFDTAVPEETLMLDPAYGTSFPDFFDTTVPVMSQRLIDTLREVGVDNFDVYPMLLRRIDTGEEFEGYSAVNFIGCVDAVDLDSSQHRLRFGKPYFTGPITIDPARTERLLAFRLLKGPGFVVVSEHPANLLRSRDFRAVLLQPTVEYAGT